MTKEKLLNELNHLEESCFDYMPDRRPLKELGMHPAITVVIGMKSSIEASLNEEQLHLWKEYLEVREKHSLRINKEEFRQGFHLGVRTIRELLCYDENDLISLSEDEIIASTVRPNGLDDSLTTPEVHYSGYEEKKAIQDKFINAWIQNSRYEFEEISDAIASADCYEHDYFYFKGYYTGLKLAIDILKE